MVLATRLALAGHYRYRTFDMWLGGGRSRPDGVCLAMKALVVSPTPFFPPQAGNRRLVKNRLEQLRAAGWRIDFVYVALEGPVSSPPETGLVDRFFVVPFRWPTNRNPVLIDVDWLAQGLQLPEEVLGKRYDLLLVNYVFCTFAATQADAAVVALETHDRFGNRHEILAASSARPSWISATVPAEAKAAARADIVAILREDDRAYYEALSDRPVMLLRHAEATRVPWPEPAALAATPLRFGFVGSSNSVNQMALHGLLAAMRRAGDRLGALRIHVFGTICNDIAPSYSELCTLHGMVESDTELYASFDVLVNPVFAGTGIKIKTIEALAFGKPVLSGAEGAAGFPVVPPQMALPSADAVVDLMIELFANPAQHESLLTEARQAFEVYLEATHGDFVTFLDAVAAGPAPRRRPATTASIVWEAAPDELLVWDLLRRPADDIANFVSIETLAMHPLARSAYLPAAVAAELCGDTRRSGRLLDVYLAALEGEMPPHGKGVVAIAERILRHPLLRRPGGADPQTRQSYRQILARTLTANRQEADTLRAELRALMRDPKAGHALLLDVAEDIPGPELRQEAVVPEDEVLPTLLPTHEPDAAAWPSVRHNVELNVHDSDGSGHYERIDVGVRDLTIENGGSIPYLFLKFLRVEGLWFLEIHPNDSPSAFISISDYWDSSDWGPTLKLPLDAQLMPMLKKRLEVADVQLLATALRAVRARLDATPAPEDAPITRLRRELHGRG